MSPRRHEPHPEDQGALFSEELVGNGAQDPENYAVTHQLEAAPDGVYPEKPVDTPPTAEETQLLEAVHKAVVTDNRRKGQLGKHSPLEREGKYADLETGVSLIKAGDVLPGFGPVTYRNMAQAESHARKLEQDRSSRRSR